MVKESLKQDQAIKTQNDSDNADIESNKRAAALSYIFVLCLIPLIFKRGSKFAQFHAKQGLVLFAAELAASLIVWFPFIGQLIMVLLFIIAIMGVVKSLNGEYWKIPHIYDWSQKIKI